ncbi:MAG: hypothetical protein HY686_03110 [Chloroflexi bacterium]|nr:hypothetical protein [Chloroflexota bacterium]
MAFTKGELALLFPEGGSGPSRWELRMVFEGKRLAKGKVVDLSWEDPDGG